ncbi:hypothetical protein RvY_01145 [Ramazzottius varieornatus]|uniref:Uncharacterized protein n=1 Tax=Ramazzottius varieornatus TaxID=947166 RepID=A0A1D1UQM3_RAMVA|nr:hypothetical protein RvY_01145 [Ramazzottius varieornatus]
MELEDHGPRRSGCELFNIKSVRRIKTCVQPRAGCNCSCGVSPRLKISTVMEDLKFPFTRQTSRFTIYSILEKVRDLDHQGQVSGFRNFHTPACGEMGNESGKANGHRFPGIECGEMEK